MHRHLILTAVLAACGTDTSTRATAIADLDPSTGQTATGTATFKDDGSVTLVISIVGAEPGVHGMHLHQIGDCSMDGMAAGGHWDGGDAAGDPANHGLPDADTHHVGDLGNITIGADGMGSLTAANDFWTLGDGSTMDVVGHAVIFHALTDDGTMPSAGARAACGVIAMQ
jgi:superoxide dismutase, Cu-Zn family